MQFYSNYNSFKVFACVYLLGLSMGLNGADEKLERNKKNPDSLKKMLRGDALSISWWGVKGAFVGVGVLQAASLAKVISLPSDADSAIKWFKISAGIGSLFFGGYRWHTIRNRQLQLEQIKENTNKCAQCKEYFDAINRLLNSTGYTAIPRDVDTLNDSGVQIAWGQMLGQGLHNNRIRWNKTSVR
jgi:hypothetical protein